MAYYSRGFHKRTGFQAPSGKLGDPAYPGRKRATLKRKPSLGPKQDTLNGKGPKPGLGAGPAAPKPKPAAVGQHANPDSGYYNAIDLADREQTQRLGELEGSETAIRHDFGIDDPTNPFSRAEGLKKAFLAKQKAQSATLASQGQLYSGAHERAVSRTRSEEEQARSELRQAYEGAIGQIGSAKAGVKFDTEEQKAQAFEDWLARAPDAEVAPDEAGAPTAPTVGGPKIGTLETPAHAKLIEEGAPRPGAGKVGTIKATVGSPNTRAALGGPNARVRHTPKAKVKETLKQSNPNSARISAIRQALMSHGSGWSQRKRLTAELNRLRG